jgi:MerR family transcriptional regulator, light-induced transcriptional regulator
MVAPAASWMPVGELSRRTGVSSDLLRKWERRYGVLKPRRTIGNQRLYSRIDEARARLMLRHIGDGMPAAQAAELAIAARFRITPDAGSASAATIDQAAEARAQMQAALERYDETTAEQALDKLLATSTTTAVIRDVILPYLHETGERWADAHLSVAQEHFASAFINSRLSGLARGWDRGLGPRALLACPSDEQHTFGLIAFGIALHKIGWRITYLGADTPIPMIAEAAASVQPRLTVVTAVTPGRLEPALPGLSDLSARGPLALAGAGASRELADRCKALHLPTDPITAAGSIAA